MAEQLVDMWIKKLRAPAVLAGWKPGRLTGHAEEKCVELLAHEAKRAEGKRLRRHLDLIAKCRALTPDTLRLLDECERRSLLVAVAAAKVDLPSDLKEALARIAMQKITKAVIAQEGAVDETDIMKLIELTIPYNKPDESTEFDMEDPTLRAIDGSAAEKAVVFKRAVIQDRFVPEIQVLAPCCQIGRLTRSKPGA